jgi:hypothetical protein
MNDAQTSYLLRTTNRYVWWKSPDEAIAYPYRIIARIMDIGILEDVRELLALFSRDELLGVLHNAQAGQFRGRSWHFWHFYLTDRVNGEVPPLPAGRNIHD